MEQSDSRDKIYCLKCKTKTETENQKQVRSKNNRLMIQGNCFIWGTTKSRFISSKKEEGWTDLPFELHPPVSLSKKYSFIGPGTKLNERLDENKNPLPHSKPVNKLDEIAMNHDICYEKYPDTKDRNKICD